MAKMGVNKQALNHFKWVWISNGCLRGNWPFRGHFGNGHFCQMVTVKKMLIPDHLWYTTPTHSTHSVNAPIQLLKCPHSKCLTQTLIPNVYPNIHSKYPHSKCLNPNTNFKPFSSQMFNSQLSIPNDNNQNTHKQTC